MDVGNKLLGVQALQAHFSIEPSRTLHVGDQFLSTGNDILFFFPSIRYSLSSFLSLPFSPSFLLFIDHAKTSRQGVHVVHSG